MQFKLNGKQNSKLLSIVCIAFLTISIFAFYVPSVHAAGVTWAYNSTTNVATASGNGTTNFAALVAADTAGGWGKFTADATGTQISCAAKIVIGDGTNACDFADSDKQVIFTDACTTTSSSALIQVKAFSSCTLGLLLDEAKFITYSGVDIISLETAATSRIILGDANSTVYLYSCGFESSTTAKCRIILTGTSNRIWNCLLDRQVAIGDCLNLNVYNVVIAKTDYGIFRSSGTFNTVIIEDATAAAFFAGNNKAFNVSGAVVKNNGTYWLAQVDSAVDNYLINCVSDTWSIGWHAAGVLYRQYTFDLNVLNGEITEFVENANVTLTKNGTIVGSWLTNSSGMIPTQTLTYGYYNQANGDNLQEGTYPFVLTITHEDWQNYTSRFYITEKMHLTVSMQDTIPESTPDPEEYITTEDGASYIIVAALLSAVTAAIVAVLILKRKQSF